MEGSSSRRDITGSPTRIAPQLLSAFSIPVAVPPAMAAPQHRTDYLSEAAGRKNPLARFWRPVLCAPLGVPKGWIASGWLFVGLHRVRTDLDGYQGLVGGQDHTRRVESSRSSPNRTHPESQRSGRFARKLAGRPGRGAREDCNFTHSKPTNYWCHLYVRTLGFINLRHAKSLEY